MPALFTCESATNQARLNVHFGILPSHFGETKKRPSLDIQGQARRQLCNSLSVKGLRFRASNSRTKRDTKLRHTPKIYEVTTLKTHDTQGFAPSIVFAKMFTSLGH